jgi:hypothetical protein
MPRAHKGGENNSKKIHQGSGKRIVESMVGAIDGSAQRAWPGRLCQEVEN